MVSHHDARDSVDSRGCGRVVRQEALIFRRQGHDHSAGGRFLGLLMDSGRPPPALACAERVPPSTARSRTKEPRRPLGECRPVSRSVFAVLILVATPPVSVHPRQKRRASSQRPWDCEMALRKPASRISSQRQLFSRIARTAENRLPGLSQLALRNRSAHHCSVEGKGHADEHAARPQSLCQRDKTRRERDSARDSNHQER